MLKTVLYSALDNLLGIYISVGLRNNFAIDGTRFMVGRSPVVFNSLRHRLDIEI